MRLPVVIVYSKRWLVNCAQAGIHLYIHLLEAGDEAGHAQPFAEKLAQLAPAASHLVRAVHISNSILARRQYTLEKLANLFNNAGVVVVC